MSLEANIEKDWEENYETLRDKVIEIQEEYFENGSSEIFYDSIQKELNNFVKNRYEYISKLDKIKIQSLEDDKVKLKIGNEYKGVIEYKEWLNRLNGNKIISLENLSGFAKTEKILDNELWISYSKNEILTSIDNHLKEELDAKKTEEIATLFTYFRQVMSDKDKNDLINKIYTNDSNNLTSEELYKRVSNELKSKINDNVEIIGFPKPFDEKGNYKASTSGEPDIVMITEEGKLVFTAANKYTNNIMESDQIIRHTTLLLVAKENTKDFPSKNFHKEYIKIHEKRGSKESARYLSEEVFKNMTEKEVEEKLNNEIIITFFQPKTVNRPNQKKVKEHFNYKGIIEERDIKIHQRNTNSFIDFLTAEAQNINNEQIEMNKGKEHIFNGFRRVQHNQTSKSYNIGKDIHKEQQDFFEKGLVEMLENYDFKNRLENIHTIPNDDDYIEIEAINSILMEETKKTPNKLTKSDFTKMATNYHTLKAKVAQDLELSEDESKQFSNYKELIKKLPNSNEKKTFPNITTYNNKIKDKQGSTLLESQKEYDFSDFEYRVAVAMNSSNPIREALIYTMSDLIQTKMLSNKENTTRELIDILLEWGKQRVADLRLDKNKVQEQQIELVLDKSKLLENELEKERERNQQRENELEKERELNILKDIVIEKTKNDEYILEEEIKEYKTLSELLDFIKEEIDENFNVEEEIKNKKIEQKENKYKIEVSKFKRLLRKNNKNELLNKIEEKEKEEKVGKIIVDYYLNKDIENQNKVKDQIDYLKDKFNMEYLPKEIEEELEEELKKLIEIIKEDNIDLTNNNLIKEEIRQSIITKTKTPKM